MTVATLGARLERLGTSSLMLSTLWCCSASVSVCAGGAEVNVLEKSRLRVGLGVTGALVLSDTGDSPHQRKGKRRGESYGDRPGGEKIDGGRTGTGNVVMGLS